MGNNQRSHAWWQTGIIYQIYPRSFQDSNGDGVGDLNGIIQRLDYLHWLGIAAIWISPVFPSPMKDFGYDISNYTDIDPLFGNMDDLDRLIAEVHQRDMKLILDFVPNHTSDQHPWFLESRSSRDNPKRDWYIWQNGKEDGGPPNNWLAMFGGTAWEWDERTRQYYYHAFLKEQPDLNWRHPEVQQAMLDVLRFWLDRGVDGFRVDVMWHMIKDEQLRDNPSNPEYISSQATYNQLLPVYSTDQQEVHDIVHEMRKLLNSYDDRMMIGEIYLPIHRLVAYYGPDNNGAHLPFNFLLLDLPWNAPILEASINEYEGMLPKEGWPNWVLSNHDQPRITSRVGKEQSKVAAMLLLTLRGTPTIYYGDEIGMRDVPIPGDEIRDPQGLNMPGKNLSRDPARTPMRWDSSPYAGFSTRRPWLSVGRNFQRENVAAQKDDPFSFLSLYKRIISLRQSEPSLNSGSYQPVLSDAQLISYIRRAPGHPAFLIILNLTHKPSYFTAPHGAMKGTVSVATTPELERTSFAGQIHLGGDEGVVVQLEEHTN